MTEKDMMEFDNLLFKFQMASEISNVPEQNRCIDSLHLWLGVKQEQWQEEAIVNEQIVKLSKPPTELEIKFSYIIDKLRNNPAFIESLFKTLEPRRINSSDNTALVEDLFKDLEPKKRKL